jgi:glycosyltransferase involved in cell wall biosynthesis
MSSMANHWAAKGHEVPLIPHDRTENAFFPLDRTVIRYGFDISKPPRHIGDTIRHNIQRISLPRSAMKEIRPDVAISFTVRMNIQNLIALTGTGIPIIVSERNNPLAQRQPLPWEPLRRHLYPRSSALVVQTDAAREWASAFMPPHKIHVIPNPVSIPETTSPGARPGHPDRPIVCSLGRLIPSKGFDLLIRSFHAASRDKPEWTLQILGEGEDRPRLEGSQGTHIQIVYTCRTGEDSFRFSEPAQRSLPSFPS